MNAASADFAATTPWSGIIGKPFYDPAPANNALLVWSEAEQKWTPITLAQLKALLNAIG